MFLCLIKSHSILLPRLGNDDRLLNFRMDEEIKGMKEGREGEIL